MGIDIKTEATTTELAAVLGITARRVRQLTQDGVIAGIGGGKYLLCDAVQRYTEFKAQPKVDDDERKAIKELRDAEVSTKKSKAIKAGLEAKELMSKMFRVDDYMAITEEMIYTFRGALLAVPGRLAVDVAAISNPAEASERIRKEMNEVMEELSRFQFDIKKYEERVRDRMNWDQTDHKDEDDE